MTIEEMIEVLQAYKEGKKIEMFVDAADRWVVVEYPLWNFKDCKYRVKKIPTRLEVANKVWEETFGIADRFTNHSCPGKDCKYCPIDKNPYCVMVTMEKWWNEEWKGEN